MRLIFVAMPVAGRRGDPAFVASFERVRGGHDSSARSATGPNERPKLVPSVDRRWGAKNREP